MRPISEESKTQPALPNFLIAGAAKCGTTALYYYLRQHPDVFMSSLKEPKFLSARVANPGKGPGDYLITHSSVGSLDEYVHLFEKGISRKALGEASVDTIFYFDRTIPAIKRYLGDPRIIIILRDPVERAYSAYKYLVRDGREHLSFADGIKMEEKRKQDGYAHMWQYRKGGLYAKQVHAFQKNFSRVLVLLHEDLNQNAGNVIRTVFSFLQVDPDFLPDIRHRHNVSGTPRWRLLNDLFVKPKRLHQVVRPIGEAIWGPDQWVHIRERFRSVILRRPLPMDPDIKKDLRRFFRDDILKLQDYIQRDLSAWLGKDPV